MKAHTSQIIPFPPRHFPPRGLKERAFSAQLRKANLALQEYASALAGIPTSLLSHLSTLEAIASVDARKIKNPLKEVFYLRSASVKPILHYIQALNWADKKPLLTKSLICTLHKKVKQGNVSKRDLGAYRKRQNWIGPVGCTIEEAYFYPPAPKYVEPMMQKLLRYSRMRKKEPLLQLAIFFAQFLIIHPFMDGNGRVARILIPLFLYEKKVTPLPLFFMSHYFKRHRLRYFQYLYQTTKENRWEDWISFFMKGVCSEARRGKKMVHEMRQLYETLHQERIRGLNNRITLFLFRQPVFSLLYFEKAGGSKQLLTRLCHLSWIKKDKDLFIFHHLIKVLKQ